MASSTIGVNKRAREEKLKEANKSIREPLNSFLPFEAELRDIQSDRFKDPISDSHTYNDISSDDDSDSDKMDLEDDGRNQYKEGDTTKSLCTSDTDNWSINTKYPPRPKVSFNNANSTLGADDIDCLADILTGGKIRYSRKIDFLVDDLIRKTNRTLDWAGNNELSCIPSTIGPHPLTDMRLLSSQREEGDGGNHEMRSRNEDQAIRYDNSSNKLKSSFNRTGTLPLDVQHRASPNYDLQRLRQRQDDERRLHCLNSKQVEMCNENHHSGDVTHSDWPIEEIDG